MKATTTAAIIDDLEQQARTAGLETNRLLGADDSVQGLLLTVTAFPAHRLVALAKTMTAAQPLVDRDSPDRKAADSILTQLAAEIPRIHSARLPTALLLIEAIPGRPAATPRQKHTNKIAANVNQEIVSVLQNSDAANALVGQYDENTFALLLTGISIAKTLSMAGELAAEIRLRPLLRHLICTLGVAFAPAGCNLSAEPFLALAAAQLPQARLALPDRLHHAIFDSAKFSCQVTAEERAVLFLQPR